QDRAGAWTQADSHNRRQPALPPAPAGELARLRPVRMAPGRCVLLTMMMVVAMVVVMLVVTVVVMMMFMLLRPADVRAHRMQRPGEVARGVKKCPALHPDQPQTDQRDQRIAGNLDVALGPAHRRHRGIEEDGGDADKGD